MESFKTYIISLKNSDRRLSIKDNFKFWKSPYEIYDACDLTRNLKDYEYLINKEKILDKYGEIIGIGEVGCALSHLKLYAKLLNDDVKYYVIFEDDSRPGIDCHDLISEVVKKNFRVDVLSFFSGCAVINKTNNLEINKYKLYKVVGRLDNTVGYMISKNMAEEIIKITKGKVESLADWPIILNKYNVYISENQLLDHINTDSSLNEDRIKRPLRTFKSMILFIIKKAFKYKSIKLIHFHFFHHIVPGIISKYKIKKYVILSHFDLKK